MNRNRYLILCVLVLAGAFAGGYAANRALPVVHAQEAMPIRATSFTLTDSQGRTHATLRSGPSGAELVLHDSTGQSRIEISASSGIVVRDRNGRVTWSSPRAGVVPATE